jgi:hypothetical protein
MGLMMIPHFYGGGIRKWLDGVVAARRNPW